MALITCPECKKSISDSADACPSCGYKIAPDKIAEIKKEQQKLEKGSAIGCLTVIAILAILYVIGFFFVRLRQHKNNHTLGFNCA